MMSSAELMRTKLNELYEFICDREPDVAKDRWFARASLATNEVYKWELSDGRVMVITLYFPFSGWDNPRASEHIVFKVYKSKWSLRPESSVRIEYHHTYHDDYRQLTVQLFDWKLYKENMKLRREQQRMMEKQANKLAVGLLNLKEEDE